MAAHSSIIPWRIPWTEEPGRLQSMGSQRVGHYRSNLAGIHALFAKKHSVFYWLFPNNDLNHFRKDSFVKFTLRHAYQNA